jgi:hypothetical protein
MDRASALLDRNARMEFGHTAILPMSAMREDQGNYLTAPWSTYSKQSSGNG